MKKCKNIHAPSWRFICDRCGREINTGNETAVYYDPVVRLRWICAECFYRIEGGHKNEKES